MLTREIHVQNNFTCLTIWTTEIYFNRNKAVTDILLENYKYSHVRNILIIIRLFQCSRYPLATSPMAIIWPIGQLKLVSGEIFDYKLQPK